MQVPKRKSEENKKFGGTEDHFLSRSAIAALEAELSRLEKVSHPRASEELRRAAEMGDRSENAAYHDAKGRLMRINTRILEIREELKNAIAIVPGASADGRARIGATVVVEVNGSTRTYEITGSQETNPTSGRISHLSPLGSAIMGKKAGDIVTVNGANGKEIHYNIKEVR